MNEDNELLLEVENLAVHFRLDEGVLKAVDGIDFALRTKSTLGVVGESGCGKSVTFQAIMGIVPFPGTVSGTVWLHRSREGGRPAIDLAALPPDGQVMRGIRGKDITMIFQEPMTSFSPLYTMGNQLMEAILLHRTRDRKEAREIAIQMLGKVGIAEPAKRIDEYPHEFSGGMRQRVMIAMALSCNPVLLIADEPTTALDVTIQAQVLELMKSLQQEFGMSVLYITHDLGVIAEMANDVAVMYLGKIVEMAPVDGIFYDPLHPYTTGLLKAIPRIGSRARGKLASIEGVVPVPLELPPRCGFFDRCPRMIAGLCDSHDVPVAEVSPGHQVRCFLYPAVMEAHEARSRTS